MRHCKDCVYYKKKCILDIGNKQRKANIEDYDFDCFCSVEDKLLCDLMCGDVEE